MRLHLFWSTGELGVLTGGAEDRPQLRFRWMRRLRTSRLEVVR